jgi:hypothetical protein
MQKITKKNSKKTLCEKTEKKVFKKVEYIEFLQKKLKKFFWKKILAKD